MLFCCSISLEGNNDHVITLILHYISQQVALHRYTTYCKFRMENLTVQGRNIGKASHFSMYRNIRADLIDTLAIKLDPVYCLGSQMVTDLSWETMQFP